MRKYHRIVGVIIFSFIAVATAFSYVSQVQAAPVKSWTTPFGGRVLSTTIPAVTCVNPSGTAPVVLSSNLAGLVQATSSSYNANQGVGQRIQGVAVGLYKAIPLYTLGTNSKGATMPQPKPGQWILGNQKLIPNTSICVIDGINVPLPVVETSTYGVSGQSWKK